VISRRRVFGSLLVLSLLLLPAGPVSPQPQEENQDVCDSCSEDKCGCGGPSAGCTLTASCTCPSNGNCSVTCTYQCE
jgi:hypothetical protein